MLAAPIPRIKRPAMTGPPGPAVLRKVTRFSRLRAEAVTCGATALEGTFHGMSALEHEAPELSYNALLST